MITAWSPRAWIRDRGKRLVRRSLAEEHAASLAVRRPWNVAPGQLRSLVEEAAERGFEVLYQGGTCAP